MSVSSNTLPTLFDEMLLKLPPGHVLRILVLILHQVLDCGGDVFFKFVEEAGFVRARHLDDLTGVPLKPTGFIEKLLAHLPPEKLIDAFFGSVLRGFLETRNRNRIVVFDNALLLHLLQML